MVDLFAGAGFSREDKIGCIRRELKMRRQVYPRWVANGKMAQDDADREIAVMESVLKDLELSGLRPPLGAEILIRLGGCVDTMQPQDANAVRQFAFTIQQEERDGTRT